MAEGNRFFLGDGSRSGTSTGMKKVLGQRSEAMPWLPCPSPTGLCALPPLAPSPAPPLPYMLLTNQTHGGIFIKSKSTCIFPTKSSPITLSHQNINLYYSAVSSVPPASHLVSYHSSLLSTDLGFHSVPILSRLRVFCPAARKGTLMFPGES